MALPDSGNVEDYTESEMNDLLAMDKAQLSKNQKAAVARYNFRKAKGEPIPFKGSAAAAPAAAPVKPEGPAGVPPAADITAMLSPEMQVLAGKDPATLTKDEKIALAKAKSQAMRASASGGPSGAAKPAGPTPEEVAAKKALGFAHAKEIDARFGAQKAIVGWAMQTDKPTAIVAPERVLDVVRYLAMEMGFDQIRDLTAADYPPDRLEVVYNLYRHSDKAHIALKTKVPRNQEGEDLPVVPSIVSVYAGADWLEREVFDLLGIRFAGHPYMRRLMMPDGWVGHPLRKDYDSRKEQFIGLDEKGNDVVSFESSTGW